MNKTQHRKLARLKEILHDAGSAVIALSGGTDSSFLVSVAAGVSDLRLLAITVNTPYMFTSELKEASALCDRYGVKHRELPMTMPDSVKGNPADRCYLCKTEVMKVIRDEAKEAGIAHVFDGTNADDMKEYRPGMQALKELSIRSPLLEAGLTKEEIRSLAREAGLESSDRPSNTCLLTRFPHGTLVTPDDMRKTEKAEIILADMGLVGSRVRVHGDLVRIECRKEQLMQIMTIKMREKISATLKELGYRYVTVDMEGYRSGSMNSNT
jgi:uncharacterized protein